MLKYFIFLNFIVDGFWGYKYCEFFGFILSLLVRVGNGLLKWNIYCFRVGFFFFYLIVIYWVCFVEGNGSLVVGRNIVEVFLLYIVERERRYIYK